MSFNEQPQYFMPPVANKLRILNKFAIDLISIPNLEDLFWYVAQNVVGRLNYIDCVIYRADPSQTKLTQFAALGNKNPYARHIHNPLEIQFGEGITGKVAQTKEAIIINNLDVEADYIYDSQYARSEICVPITWENKVIGVIDSEHPEANMFTDADLEVLTTVAAMTSAKYGLLIEKERSHNRHRDLLKAYTQLNNEVETRTSLEKELSDTRAKEANARLIGGLAHLLNNKFSAIQISLDSLQQDQNIARMSENTRSSVKYAYDASQTISRVMKDMMAYAQIAVFQKETFDLGAILSESLHSELSHSLDITIKIDHDSKFIQGNKRATKEALGHIIDYSKERLQPEGGAITISSQKRTLRFEQINQKQLDIRSGDYILVEIHDTAEAIPNGLRSALFDPFRTEMSVSDGSNGLALASVKGFMQQIGGTIQYSENEKQKACFQLFFPLSA